MGTTSAADSDRASPASVWLDAPVQGRPPLDGDLTADVAIVGGGIAGIATAYALARQGIAAVVLERDRVASAASGRNAGFVLAGVAENFVAACRRYGSERAARIWRFTVSNRVFLASAVRRSGIECELAWNGSTQLAGDEPEWEEIRDSARQLAAHGVRVKLDPTICAACYEDDGEIHPARFVRGLARAAEGLGARVYERTEVSRVRPDAVHTSTGTVRAGSVVVCTNAYTEHLLRGSRIAPTRGQMLATAPVTRRLFERPIYANRGYRYWRQTADGRVLVGGWRNEAFDEEVGEEARPTERIQSFLDGFLGQQGIDAPVTHRWAGIMGFSHDGLPYIGRRSDRIYVNAAFTGHGNAFAMAGGELIASLIRTGRHQDADLFDPARP